MKLIGVFAATRWEVRAITQMLQGTSASTIGGRVSFVGHRGRCHVQVVQTGVGAKQAGEIARLALQQHPFDLVVSSGFSCALTPAAVGDIVVGSEVVDGAAGHFVQRTCSEAHVLVAKQAAESVGVAVRIGRIVSVPKVLWRGEEKRHVSAETGAIGGDMESVALGDAAALREVPFLVVRAVSDLVDEDLPLNFNLFLNPVDWPCGIVQAVTTPSCLPGLVRLGRQSRVAAERLQAVMAKFLEAMP